VHYLIDGYNLFFQVRKKRTGFSKKEREKAIEQLSLFLRPLKGRLTVILDGQEELGLDSFHHNYRNLELIYTCRDESADTYIVKKLSLFSSLEKVTVVTSDRDLSFQAKCLGASILSIKNFLSLVQKQRAKKKISKEVEIRESDIQMKRLLKIFEWRLQNDLLFTNFCPNQARSAAEY
jgi:predicted RNA-binding protein with PIN domain